MTATINPKQGKTPGKRHTRKPKGWECRDHIGFNNTVRAHVNVSSGHFVQEPRPSDNASFALYIFTDGSARDVSRREKCAGWCFTAMKKLPRPGDKPMVEACGQVQTNTAERLYIGATRVTNNTAEMQGVIEALFRLNTCVEQGACHATNDVLITVDSLYVKGLIEKEIRGQRKQGARYVASPHVESDEEKNTTAHSLDTQATWGTPSQIAWQMLAHARNYSIICFD